MGRKTRLANKTQWALDDICLHTDSLVTLARQGLSRAEAGHDPAMMALWSRVLAHAAQIGRIGTEARHGEYSEPVPAP